MRNSKAPKVIVFPIVRRANEVEKYREKMRKMSGDTSIQISLQLQAEADNIYKVSFNNCPDFDVSYDNSGDYGDYDGDSPKRA